MSKSRISSILFMSRSGSAASAVSSTAHVLPGRRGDHEHPGAAPRQVPAHHLVRDVQDPQPPAVAGALWPTLRLRKPLHALLAGPREDPRLHRGNRRRPGDFRVVQGRWHPARYPERYARADQEGTGAMDPADTARLKPTFLHRDNSVKRRTVGIGVLLQEQAYALGAWDRLFGPAAWPPTCELGYAVYKDLDWEPVVENGGDCYSRSVVRIGKIFQSFDLIRQAIDKIPDGAVRRVRSQALPTGGILLAAGTAARRGRLLREGNGTKFLERFRRPHPDLCQHPAARGPAGLRAAGCSRYLCSPSIPASVVRRGDHVYFSIAAGSAKPVPEAGDAAVSVRAGDVQDPHAGAGSSSRWRTASSAACARKKCPSDAIEVDRKAKTWAIDRLRCVICGACVEVCPKKCLSMDTAYTTP